MLFDNHIHTTLCKHAIDVPGEYVARALAQGLRGMVFTCHAPLPGRYSPEVRMQAEEFAQYVALVREEQLSAPDGFLIGLGLECDYLPSLSNYWESFFSAHPLDYRLGSIHPHLPEYQLEFCNSISQDPLETYYNCLALAAESGYFHALAHPDLLRAYAKEPHCQTEQAATSVVVLNVLDRIAATGVALEINTSATWKKDRSWYPHASLVREIVARGIPLLLGSDAHCAAAVGHEFHDVRAMLLEMGVRSVCTWASGVRQEIALN